MLADKTIRRLAMFNKLIQPFDEDHLSAASYDLSLDDSDKERNIIPPGTAKLVVTKEKVNLPNNIGAKTVSKSSLARIKLSIGDIGGWVDPGYRGQLSLLAVNYSDTTVDLNKFKTVCQMVLFKTDTIPEKPYAGHYQDSKGLRNAWFNDVKEDFRNVDVKTDIANISSGLIDKEFFEKRCDF